MRDTVLIIDEDANARIIAETLLKIRGLHVLSARDGTEACDIVRCEGAAVVVIGLADCEMESLQSVRALRDQFERFPSPTPRIVVAAGRREPDGYRGALRASADVFLRKPTEPKQFVAIIERLVGSIGRNDGERIACSEACVEPPAASGW